MKSLKLQPTFTVDIPSDAEQTIAALRKAIDDDELSEHAMAAGTCFEFFIAPAQQRFWSPHLSIQVSSLESGSQLFGRFSPRPEIWTMVMAIYGVMLILMFAAAIYGYVQWMLGTAPWALIVLPIGTVVIGGLHAASLVGQNLSSDQMHLLRSRLDRAIKRAFPVVDEATSPPTCRSGRSDESPRLP